MNSSVSGQATELVCFRIDEPLDLRRVAELGADSEQVKNLPLGAFVAINRITRATLTGKVF